MGNDLPLPQLHADPPHTDAPKGPPPQRPRSESIDRLHRPELIARYRRGIAVFHADILKLSDQHADTPFEPQLDAGRWSIRATVAHLADAENITLLRLRRTVAEDGVILPNWDHDAFLAAGLHAGPAAPPPPHIPEDQFHRTGLPIAASIALIHAIRTTTADWLALLPEQAWARTALHPERGPTTLEQQVAHATWHLEHHAWFIDAKARQLLQRSLVDLPTPNDTTNP